MNGMQVGLLPPVARGLLVALAGVVLGMMTLLPPLYLAALVIVPIGLWLYFFYPRVLFGVGLVAFPFIEPTLSSALIAALFVRMVLANREAFVHLFRLKGDVVILGMMLFASLLSQVNSASLGAALKGTFEELVYFMLFLLVILEATDEKRIHLIIKLLIGTAAVNCLYGFAGYAVHLPSVNAGKLFASFSAPGYLSAYLLMTTPFVLLQSMTQTGKRKALLLLILVILLSALGMSFSRSGYFGMILVFLLASRRHPKLILAMAMTVIGIVVLVPGITDRFLSAFDDNGYNVVGRYVIWEGTKVMIHEKWFLGVGPGSFADMYLNYNPNALLAAKHAHNIYLHLTAETGYLGVSLFLGLIAFLAMRALILCRHSLTLGPVVRAGAFGLCGMAVHGMTENALYTGRFALVFWIVMGLLAAAARVSQQQKTDEQERVGRGKEHDATRLIDPI